MPIKSNGSVKYINWHFNLTNSSVTPGGEMSSSPPAWSFIATSARRERRRWTWFRFQLVGRLNRLQKKFRPSLCNKFQSRLPAATEVPKQSPCGEKAGFTQAKRMVENPLRPRPKEAMACSDKLRYFGSSSLATQCLPTKLKKNGTAWNTHSVNPQLGSCKSKIGYLMVPVNHLDISFFDLTAGLDEHPR